MTNVKKMEAEPKAKKESNEPKTLNEALFNVQQAAPAIKKVTDNPYFKSKYADLPSIWEVIRPLFKVNKLLVSHSIFHEEGADYIRTVITHLPSGQSQESVSKVLLQKVTAQEYGSYMTYMRRYSISAMLGLITEEDDDGNAATDAAQKEVVKNIINDAKPVNPLKEIAAKISKQLKAADNLDVLEYVWDGFEEDLTKIKAESEKAYNALHDIYRKRGSELDQINI